MKLIHLNKIDSTNEYLKRNYKSLNDFTFVYSDYQRKGKGRLNHNWESEDNKNLLCSLLLKRKINKKYINSFTIFSGVVVFKALKKLGFKNVSIKWPNDIYINNKKIAGILVETIYLDNELEALIVGIGINLNQSEFRHDLNATSYYLETNQEIDKTCVIQLLSRLFKKELFKLNLGISNYVKTINKNNYLLNKNVTVNNGQKKYNVIAANINKDGTINVLINKRLLKLDISEITLNDK